MQKSGFNSVFALATLFIVVALTGCGGGSGAASNAQITLTPSSTTVAAGTNVPVSITITGDSSSLSGIKSVVESDNPNIIASTDATESNNGAASAIVYVKNKASTVQTVNIRAKIKDSSVASSWQTLTIKPATLTIAPPADKTYPFTADSTTSLCLGGVSTIVTSNASVTFKDPSGNSVDNKSITLGVNSITNGLLGDIVTFYPAGASTVTVPPYTNTVSVNTSTNGVYLWPLAIDGTIPTNKGGQHVFTVNWYATTSLLGDDGVTITYTDTKQTMLTLQCN